MRLRFRLLLVVLSLSGAGVAAAQRRSVGDVGLLPEVQAELALKDDDYLLLGVRGPLRIGTASGLNLEQLGLNLGYERFWNEHWSGGATLRADFYNSYGGSGDVGKLYTDLTPELFVRHWNTLGSFNLRQRLGVEYFSPGGKTATGRALTRLRLDLDRLLPLSERLVIRPRLAYEAAAYLRLQRNENEDKERIIDFGTLRAEVGVRPSPHFDFTPWVATQTTYIFGLPQMDGNGQVIVAGGPRNLVSPVVGLDVRLTLFRGSAPVERRQLPTQH